MIIRDIGPLDSIIQCAGRCNRRRDEDNGNVTVVNMVDDRGYSYAAEYMELLCGYNKNIVG